MSRVSRSCIVTGRPALVLSQRQSIEDKHPMDRVFRVPEPDENVRPIFAVLIIVSIVLIVLIYPLIAWRSPMVARIGSALARVRLAAADWFAEGAVNEVVGMFKDRRRADRRCPPPMAQLDRLLPRARGLFVPFAFDWRTCFRSVGPQSKRSTE